MPTRGGTSTAWVPSLTCFMTPPAVHPSMKHCAPAAPGVPADARLGLLVCIPACLASVPARKTVKMDATALPTAWAMCRTPAPLLDDSQNGRCPERHCRVSCALGKPGPSSHCCFAPCFWRVWWQRTTVAQTAPCHVFAFFRLRPCHAAITLHAKNDASHTCHANAHSLHRGCFDGMPVWKPFQHSNQAVSDRRVRASFAAGMLDVFFRALRR